MVDEEKRRRIRLAAQAWLAARPELARCRVRFDLVAERSGRLARVVDDGF